MNKLIIFALLTATIFTAEKEDNCKWSEPTYDYKKYIRIVRQSGKDFPVNYLCWERKKLVGTIFTNIKNCIIAVNAEGGIDCYLCEVGMVPQAGFCVKEAPKSSSSSNTGSGSPGSNTSAA
jgi:hypothetical protein